MGDENPFRTLGDYSKPSHEGYRNTIELPVWNNVVPLRSNTIRLVQNRCSFYGLRSEYPNQHLKDFLKLVDSLDLDGSISTWEDLTTRFLAQFFLPGRTAKLRNDILMFQQHHGESLSKGMGLLSRNYLKKDLALYDNESWNDPREFAKLVKAIAFPQDVPSTSDRRLIELDGSSSCSDITYPSEQNHYLMLVPQSSNTKFVCSKEDDGEVMFIEIIRDDDEPQNEGPNEGEGATTEEPVVEYFDTFPTRDELTYHRENTNGGVSNFTGRIKVMHVFIGNFTYIIDFMIVEDISSIIYPRLSQVVLGRPFVEMSNMTHDPPEGVVKFTKGTDEVAYKMPHKIEQYDSLSDLEKEHTKSVYLRNDKDKRRGVEYVMSRQDRCR
ncbi:MAK10-like protein [Tanacetum coccineum]